MNRPVLRTALAALALAAPLTLAACGGGEDDENGGGNGGGEVGGEDSGDDGGDDGGGDGY